jgi:2-amino-4-hydroxy-6-hydroxymethyldihydropteridine diphosphokinase
MRSVRWRFQPCTPRSKTQALHATLQKRQGAGAVQNLAEFMAAQTLAVIALGSNLGNAQTNVLRAIERLQEISPAPLLKSSLWETSPVDCPPDSPRFVNAVVALVPGQQETPESLLHKLQQLEVEFGRVPKKVMNEPRPLDLDLIAFGDQSLANPKLILPHPRAHQRRFVLGPLSEICPELILPGQNKSVKQLLAELPVELGVRRL